MASLISYQSESIQIRWASVGGGAGLGYLFVHLLPELTSGGDTISQAVGMHSYLPDALTESFLFLIVLLGVLIPYALGVISTQHPSNDQWTGIIRLALFSLVSYLYAYSLPSLLTTGISYGLLYTVVISAHVLLADRVLDQNHRQVFRHRFRWLGSSALFLGTIHAAVFHPISDLTLAIATAFIGGGLLISVFREELPNPNQSRLGWFFLGLITMTTLLLLATSRHTHA
ncbi:hypothetical protein [Synechococcus sp. MIT S9508]|uniref:hypothetical protein n=1 Tax=Synechococcus sp. MIT S9508 TaxID=1801629 RepID=UPI001E5DE6DA|nr:hypothetical protein [Synechococcus sp. MIT S9508]